MSLSIGPSFAVHALARDEARFASEVNHARLDETHAASALDSMGEMGEMDALRLQMAMDMLSKFASTLSNLLQKQQETADAIVDTLK